jgi:rubrerythrin
MAGQKTELVTLISNLKTRRNRIEKKLNNQEKVVDKIDNHIGVLMSRGQKKSSANIQRLEIKMDAELVALIHYYDLLEKLVNHISQVKQKLTSEFDV